MLSDIFSKLDEWRHLPSYQLERRVDVFFGLFLPEVVADLIDRGPSLGDVSVVPEFPLHKGLVGISQRNNGGDDNQSVKVDFAVFSRDSQGKQIFLVELKTDCKSINKAQLENMVKAKSAGPKILLEGVLRAAKASAEPRKYAQLIWKLHQLGCIETPPGFEQMRMEHHRPGLAANVEGCFVGGNWPDAEVDLVLLYPKKPKRNDEQNADLYSKFRCMTFSEIAAIIEKSQQAFASDFAMYLRNWSRQDAGYKPLVSRRHSVPRH